MASCAASCGCPLRRTRARSSAPRSRAPRCSGTPTARRRSASSSFPEGWSMWWCSARRAAALLLAAGQPFTTDLKRSIEGGGTAKLVTSPDGAQAILDITAVENNKQILSLTSGGKVSEFLLTKRIVFRVHDKEGNDWLPSSEIVIRRTYTYSDTEALAKAYEEQRLWRDMQDDAVQLIVRRLQAARKPVA